MKILAIDPSTKSSGIAIFQNSKLIYHTCIENADPDVITRIKEMAYNIRQVYLQYKPDKIVMEEVLPQDVNHSQTTYKALIYLQAAIVMMLHNFQADITFFTASHWRAQVGIRTGRGIKRDTLKVAAQQKIKQKYDLTVNNDVADAICIGLAYINETQSAF